jgi:uncharacterized membrane protein YfcA
MDPTHALLLILAGVGAGLCGSVAGLASLVSYPALLAHGLPPLAANVTNTTAMFATTAGAALGSRAELHGQGRRLAGVMVVSALGGVLGAALLTTPAPVFAAVVPWLVALGAVLLLARDRVREQAQRVRRRLGGSRPWLRRAWLPVIALVGLYGGYFGAGAGIIMLAVLAVRYTEPWPVTNAVKNLGTGTANMMATGVYVLAAPVDLPAAATLGVGALVGAWLGPGLVRVLPERPLRIAIGLAGLGLAAWLAVG